MWPCYVFWLPHMCCRRFTRTSAKIAAPFKFLLGPTVLFCSELLGIPTVRRWFISRCRCSKASTETQLHASHGNTVRITATSQRCCEWKINLACQSTGANYPLQNVSSCMTLIFYTAARRHVSAYIGLFIVGFIAKFVGEIESRRSTTLHSLCLGIFSACMMFCKNVVLHGHSVICICPCLVWIDVASIKHYSNATKAKQSALNAR